MLLPRGFAFTQDKLQDYVDCPRRFQLRHVLMQPWPDLVLDSPVDLEAHLRRGADFHHLAHQHALGLSANRLEASIQDPILARWWRTYLAHPPPGLPDAVRRPELVLSAPVAGFRLVARLDLLAVQPAERAVIVDWKTPLRRPSRAVLAGRLQTRVYRSLLVEAGAAHNDGRALQPVQVEMVYWFAEHDGATERFRYSDEEHVSDRRYLLDLVSEVADRREEIWPLTADVERCHLCNYRSLCDRQVQPAFLEALEDDLGPAPLDFDLEQIAEVAF